MVAHLIHLEDHFASVADLLARLVRLDLQVQVLSILLDRLVQPVLLVGLPSSSRSSTDLVLSSFDPDMVAIARTGWFPTSPVNLLVGRNCHSVADFSSCFGTILLC